MTVIRVLANMLSGVAFLAAILGVTSVIVWASAALWNWLDLVSTDTLVCLIIVAFVPWSLYMCHQIGKELRR